MDEFHIILLKANDDGTSSESLISVKLLFNLTTINKSLLSLQRQRCSSMYVTNGLSVWN